MIVRKLSKTGSLVKPKISQKLKSGFVVLNPGEEVGEHITDKREEIIIIMEGRATIILEGKPKTINKNNLVFIPEDKKHNVINKTKKVLKYIYIVTSL